jgi:glycine oxidase
VRWIDGEAARVLEPQLSPASGAPSIAAGAPGEPGQAGAGLARAAEARGAVIRQETPVAGLLRRGARVTGVRLAGETLWADNVVLAAGPWTKRLAAALGVSVPVRPVRGQMLALGGGPSPVRHIIWGPRGYMAPKANGFLFVGATVEEVGFRKTTTTRGLSSLRRMANELVPALTHATQVDAWAAFRPGSVDGCLSWAPRRVGTDSGWPPATSETASSCRPSPAGSWPAPSSRAKRSRLSRRLAPRGLGVVDS